MRDSENKGKGVRRKHTANGNNSSLLGYNFSYLRDDKDTDGDSLKGYNYSYLDDDKRKEE